MNDFCDHFNITNCRNWTKKVDKYIMKNSTEILYKVTDYYSSKHEKTILWKDKAININWPKVKKQINISKKDKLGISLEKYLNLKDI